MKQRTLKKIDILQRQLTITGQNLYSHTGNSIHSMWMLGMTRNAGTELRFAKGDLPLLKELLGVPDKISCQQGTTGHNKMMQ